jgi:hypothetical protein
MEASGNAKEYKLTLTERGLDGRCVAYEFTVSEAQYALLLMALGEDNPEAYTTGRQPS